MFSQTSRHNLNQNSAFALLTFDKVLPNMSESLGELITRRMRDLGVRSKSELARRLELSSAVRSF